MARELTIQSYQERLLKVQIHIQEHLDEELALETLAEMACFSPYHFHRIFHGMVGEPVKEYVRRLRLQRAAGELIHTRKPIIEIAFRAGYENHESFTQAFREAFAMAPSRYRTQSRKQESLEPIKFPDDHTKAVDPEKGDLSMDVKIVKVKPKRVVFMRHVGPYGDCGKIWERFLPWAGVNGLLGPGVEIIGLCHDNPDVTPPEKIRYDACLTVDEIFQPEGEVGVQIIAGGEYAMATHFGPYNTLGETYTALCGVWAPQSGRELRSIPGFEIYLNDPETTEPEELLTDIYIPLELA